MKIGVDLDGVIFDSEKLYRVCSELYDVIDLKKNTIVNSRELRFQKRYAWSEEETKGFIDKYHLYIVNNANFMPGAKEVLKMLKNEGHELIIITARGSQKQELIEITEDIFECNDLEIFNKCYWGVEDKAKICKYENIDLMIDDYIENCKAIANEQIKTIYFQDAPSFIVEDSEYIKTLYNWGGIYRYIRGACATK